MLKKYIYACFLVCCANQKGLIDIGKSLNGKVHTTLLQTYICYKVAGSRCTNKSSISNARTFTVVVQYR